MNSWSIVIGSIIIIISLIITIVGGLEKFHLQKKNDAWLALFVVGMIGIIAGAILLAIGFYSNRAKKISLAANQRLLDIYNYNKSQNTKATATVVSSPAVTALIQNTTAAMMASGASQGVAQAAAQAAAAAATSAASMGSSLADTAAAAGQAAAAAVSASGVSAAGATIAATAAAQAVNGQGSSNGVLTTMASPPVAVAQSGTGQGTQASGVATSGVATSGVATSGVSSSGIAAAAESMKTGTDTNQIKIAAASIENNPKTLAIEKAASKYSEMDTTNIYDYIRKRNPTSLKLPRESLCPITYKPLKEVGYSTQRLGGLFD